MKKLNRNVVVLSFVSFFNDLSNGMIQSVMPVFLNVTLGVPPSGVGLIEGAADAIASVLKIVSGRISDRTERRKLPTMLGYALSVGTRPLLVIASSFASIAALRIIDRVGKGFREAPRDALLAESADQGDLGRSFNFNRGMDALGGMLGPLIALAILPLIGNDYRTLFVIAFIVGILALLSFVFVREAPKRVRVFSENDAEPSLRSERKLLLFVASIFVYGLGTIPLALVLLRPVELGMQYALVPLLYLLYNMAFVASTAPFGRLSDRIGERIVIVIGFVASIAGYILLASTHSLAGVVVAFVLFGKGAAATDGIGRALAAKLVSPRLLATSEGLLNAAIGFSSLIAGLAAGYLWEVWGAPAAFLYAAAVSLIGLGIFALVSFNGWVRYRAE